MKSARHGKEEEREKLSLSKLPVTTLPIKQIPVLDSHKEQYIYDGVKDKEDL